MKLGEENILFFVQGGYVIVKVISLTSKIRLRTRSEI